MNGSAAELIEQCPCCKQMVVEFVTVDEPEFVWGDCPRCVTEFVSGQFDPIWEGEEYRGIRTKPLDACGEPFWCGNGPPCGRDHDMEVLYG